MSDNTKLHPFEVLVVEKDTNKILVPRTTIMMLDVSTAKMEAARMAADTDVNNLRIFVRPFC